MDGRISGIGDMRAKAALVRVCGALAVALLLASCATPLTRIRDHPHIYARATPEQQALIGKGQIALGFTPEFVRLALGKPEDVSERTGPSGTFVVWTYLHYRYYYPTYWGGPFGWPYYGYGWPYFGPNIIAPVAIPVPHLQVTFRDGVAVAIDRSLHD
ncbi:MAG TPA: hypothetical protein VF265_04040 [Nevskiaceae bacterium]